MDHGASTDFRPGESDHCHTGYRRGHPWVILAVQTFAFRRRGPVGKIWAKITSIIIGLVVLAIGCVLIIAPLYPVESAMDDVGIDIAENSTDDPTVQETIAALKADNLALATEREVMTAKMSELNEQVANLHNQARRLEARIDQVTISGFFKFSTGEHDSGTRIRPRHYCGHDVNAEAKQLCGDETAVTFVVDDRAGDKCGYTDYVVACLRD
jgi:hypothetical protein